MAYWKNRGRYCAALVLAWIGTCATARAAAGLVSFSPTGTVVRVHQVKAIFSGAIVPLGSAEGLNPFKITCPEKGIGRWLDQKTWVYDFGGDLPAGVACTFALDKDLKALDGTTVTRSDAKHFNTGGPRIVSSIPYEGSEEVTEDQIFLLRLSTTPLVESIATQGYFTADGIGERIPMQLVDGTDRKVVLSTHKSLVKNAGQDKIVLVRAGRRLPPGMRIKLVWGKGIKAAPSGLASQDDQALAFMVRSDFTAELSCTRVNAGADCLPIDSLRLKLSAPVSVEAAHNIVLTAGGQTWQSAPADTADTAEVRGGVLLVQPPGAKAVRTAKKHGTEPQQDVREVRFIGPFPPKSKVTINVPADLRDDGDRTLSNRASFPLVIKTDDYPPLAKFAANFGIVEWGDDAMLPITVRGLEPEVEANMVTVRGGPMGLDGGEVAGAQARLKPDPRVIMQWFTKVQRKADAYDQRGQPLLGQSGAEASLSQKPSKFTLPRREAPGAYEVVGLPMKAPGVYVVEVASHKLGSALLGAPKPMYVATMALVTDLSVHLKWGQDRSLVWVTSLRSGQPVAGAQVAIADCSGKEIATGVTKDDGVVMVTGLPRHDRQTTCDGKMGFYNGLFVTATKGDDLSFVHSGWDHGIESWRFQVQSGLWDAPEIAHSVLDRTLLRAGEVLHAKHFMRSRGSAGWSVPTALPKKLIITHLGSNQTYEQPLRFAKDGSAETTWDIPKEAKLGAYSMTLTMDDKSDPERAFATATFRVEEFRLPLLQAAIIPPVEPIVGQIPAHVDLSVRYLAGGGAANLPIKLRTLVQPGESVAFDNFEGYSFGTGAVREGISQPLAEDGEGEQNADAVGPANDDGKSKSSAVHTANLVLDAQGTTRAPLPPWAESVVPFTVLTEMQFNDPNGEVQTIARRIPIYPSQRLIAVKFDDWGASTDKLTFRVAVADVRGKAVAGVEVAADVLQRQIYSHRKRLVGGFYAYEHREEVRRLGAFCQGKTDDHGILICTGKAPATGNLIAEATVYDGDHRKAVANAETWVTDGSQDLWFEAADNDRIDLIPSAKSYEPGDTAKIQVRSPFREATALVAIEQDGVLETFVKEISGKDPIIDVPVKPNYAPNVYVSVLVVRGRVGEPQPTATVDLGRPAYKLGIVGFNVGWRAHELKVQVTADKQTYHVRDHAEVDVKVTTADDSPLPSGGEVAVAAVDEALLELMDNQTWKILPAMMRTRGYGIQNATAAMHVVGKRHFGLKAQPTGGGGGRSPTRELFDTLLFWSARARLGVDGSAHVKIPLNDAMTGFRIVAIATAGTDRFGTGATSIKSTQDLMLFSGLPLVVRGGDKFSAMFTARNATDHEMTVTVRATLAVDKAPAAALEGQKELTLAAGEAKDLTWPVVVPVGASQLVYQLEAKDKSGNSDRLKITQQAQAVTPVRTQQATLSQVTSGWTASVQRPPEALPDLGGVDIALQSSLGGSLAGVREYMEQYPYSCLEQQVSRIVALRDERGWQRLSGRFAAYVDGDGLLMYFPGMEHGSAVLSAYVLAIAEANGSALPPSVQDKVLDGLTAFIKGRGYAANAAAHAPASVQIARKLAALAAVSRYRALDAQMIDGISATPNQWPTASVLDWLTVIERQNDLKGRDALKSAATAVLRARLDRQGTVINVRSDQGDQLWWLMSSGDELALKLIALYANASEWREDMPLLARGALTRQRRGHWDLTTANAWGTVAMAKFSQVFEKEAVAGTTQVSLAGDTRTMKWTSRGDAPPAVTLPWPGAGIAAMTASHLGTGKPWLLARLMAAVPRRSPVSAGFTVDKSITPVDSKTNGRWARGDLVRVKLTVTGTSPMSWVVVDDPIPAGATILGNGLGRDSALASRGEAGAQGNWPAFEQRSLTAYRAYYESTDNNTWSIEYTMRLNNSGHFSLPPTRIEAMYAPEMFGERPNDAWDIGEG